MIDFGYLWNLYGPAFIAGTQTTLLITFVAVGMGIAIGLPLALFCLYGPRPLRLLATGYIEVFRGTPLLVQLFVVYFGLPSYGIVLDPLIAAFVTLGMNSGAYQAELYRGAILSVESGQFIAARAVGMTHGQTLRHIVLPQALRAVIPSWSNELIGVMKGTAVVFLISVEDLMGEAKIIFGRTFDPIQAYSVVAVVYLVLIGATVLLLGLFERRLRLPVLDVGTGRR
jgi:polar amino acid transport system permease protein